MADFYDVKSAQWFRIVSQSHSFVLFRSFTIWPLYTLPSISFHSIPLRLIAWTVFDFERATFIRGVHFKPSVLSFTQKPLSHASLKRFTFEAKVLRFSRNKTFIASFFFLLLCLLLRLIWPNRKSNNSIEQAFWIVGSVPLFRRFFLL